MTPPAPNLTNNTPNSQPHLMSERTEPRLDEITCRRIITFAAPKTEFDLQGQYYSDPNLLKINERTHQTERQSTEDCPIDLTKRPSSTSTGTNQMHHQQHQQFVQQRKQIKPKVSDVVLPITNTASLLASLMSITDKFPMQNQNGVEVSSHFVMDQPNLPHKYITDRALLDTKIKQSQVKLMVNVAGSNLEGSENHVILPELAVIPVVSEQRVESMDEAGISMMDTLAEVAASSVKLDVTPIHSPKLVNEDSSKQINVQNEPEARNSNAKSIATEILKLTQNAQNPGKLD